MKTVGIIAEYNPFHLGHKYQLQYAREVLGADFIVIAMSGDYVQRGAPALFPKHLRARSALLCGADLVLELPVSISTASAEFFAKGAVELLDQACAADILCFGAEAGENGLFMETARLLLEEPALYQETLKAGLKAGLNFPSARSKALLHYLSLQHSEYSAAEFHDFLSSPNNILGIEYCKAILKLHSKIMPAPLLRKGSGYHDTSLSSGNAPSASGIRQLIKESCTDGFIGPGNPVLKALEDYVPAQIYSLFSEALIRKNFLLEDDFDQILHYCLLSLEPEEMWQYLDVSPALARRITNNLSVYQGFLPFTELLKTKEMTYTRISRALLHLLLHIKKVPGTIPYARVLGFRKTAAPLLKKIKINSRIPLVTSPSTSARTMGSSSLLLLKENTFASNIYESLACKKQGRAFVHEYTKPVIIL